MLICYGTHKKPICLRNSGHVSQGQDWLLERCRALQKKKVPITLKYSDGSYFPLVHEENLLMAVEMAFVYYQSSLDPRDFPEWMDHMDKVWQNYSAEDDEEPESESESDECYDPYDYYW
jgi:hypothetical protein